MDLDETHERLTMIEAELDRLERHSDEIDAQFEIVHSWEGISEEIDLALLRIRDAIGIIEDEWRLRERR